MSDMLRNGVEGAQPGPEKERRPGSQSNHRQTMLEIKAHSSVLTLQQAAAYLRISKAHLANVIQGKVPGVPRLNCARIGRRILIKREWADEWLEKAGQGSF